jgi:hypothetical protein
VQHRGQQAKLLLHIQREHYADEGLAILPDQIGVVAH